MDKREETMLRILCVLLDRLGGQVDISELEIAASDDMTVIAERDDSRMVLVVNLIPGYVKIGVDAPPKPVDDADPVVRAAWDVELAKWLGDKKKTVSPLEKLRWGIAPNNTITITNE